LVSAICGTGTKRAIHSFEKKPTPRLIVSLLFVLLAYATTAQAQSYRAEAFRSSPPEELSLAIRETLTNEGVRVVGPSGILCELWLRKAIPIRLEENKELGVSFGQIADTNSPPYCLPVDVVLRQAEGLRKRQGLTR